MLNFDLMELEANNGDIFLEEAEHFSDSVDAAINHGACRAHLENLFNFGIDYRQEELNQRLIGQSDHASFRIIDAALDILEGAL